jgi:hypothetical protein
MVDDNSTLAKAQEFGKGKRVTKLEGRGHCLRPADSGESRPC